MLIVLISLGLLLTGLIITFIREIIYKIYKRNDKIVDKFNEEKKPFMQLLTASQYDPNAFKKCEIDEALNRIKELDDKKMPYAKKSNKYYDIWRSFYDAVYYSITAIVLGSILTISCSVIILAEHSPKLIQRNMDLINKERQVLVYRLETRDPIGNEYLYHDIMEFNKKIYDYHFWHDSIWTSWFNPEEYTTIQPIEYEILPNSAATGGN